MGKNESKVRINPMKFTKAIIILIIICALLIGTGYFIGRSADGSNRYEKISAVVLQNKITQISELATVTYAYTELGQYENSKEFYGATVPFTTSKFILTYDGVIKVGIDLSKAEVSVEGKTVEVLLPEAEVLSHEIIEDSVKVFDEKKSIFNPFSVKDYTAFYADEKKKAEKKAVVNGVVEEASKQASSTIKKFIGPMLNDSEYTLKVQMITQVEE